MIEKFFIKQHHLLLLLTNIMAISESFVLIQIASIATSFLFLFLFLSFDMSFRFHIFGWSVARELNSLFSSTHSPYSCCPLIRLITGNNSISNPPIIFLFLDIYRLFPSRGFLLSAFLLWSALICKVYLYVLRKRGDPYAGGRYYEGQPERLKEVERESAAAFLCSPALSFLFPPKCTH